jgi:hypothetical protein
MADRIDTISGQQRGSPVRELDEKPLLADPYSIYNNFGVMSLNPNGAGENEDYFLRFDAAIKGMSNFQLAAIRDMFNHLSSSIAGINNPEDRNITANNVRQVAKLIDQRLGYKHSTNGADSWPVDLYSQVNSDAASSGTSASKPKPIEFA